MNLNLSLLGSLIKKYRKAHSYSTQQLADELNISAGLINNIENAKNDVFKLELLMSFITKLNIPVPEIMMCIFNVNKYTSSLADVPCTDLGNAFNKYIELISSEFALTISQYDDKEKATELLGNLILQELNSISKIKHLK